jgi:putative protein kinase ArgK-like GTPase of G3E family
LLENGENRLALKNFSELLKDTLKQNRRSFSQALSLIPQLSKQDEKILLHEFLTQNTVPSIIGLFGTPGAGKSSFLNLLSHYRKDFYPQRKIGLLLIDPSSPIHGGSILGDRVRLTEHFLEDEVYIRSISNETSLDGLNPRLAHYLMLFTLFKFDLILVESVGGGQASTNLKRFVDRLVMIYDPHSGDGVQHLKGGALDVAQDVIISKADLINVSMTIQSLKEWSNPNLNFHSANLTQKDSLNNFFQEIFEKTSQNSFQNLPQVLLWQEAEREFRIHFDNYYTQFIKNTQMSEENIQVFRKNFPHFFLKNT